ncbi:MAG TPA: hypothetical protein VND87_12130 [Stellaceae bacterium]|nr:hypothetical protein [Stellaceae bacterium]
MNEMMELRKSLGSTMVAVELAKRAQAALEAAIARVREHDQRDANDRLEKLEGALRSRERLH